MRSLKAFYLLDSQLSQALLVFYLSTFVTFSCFLELAPYRMLGIFGAAAVMAMALAMLSALAHVILAPVAMLTEFAALAE